MNFKKTLGFLFLSIFILFLVGFFNDAQAISKVNVYYFYSSGCHACEGVKPVISSLEERYNYVEFHKYDLLGNQENLDLFEKFQNSFCESEEFGIPVVFIGDTHLHGRSNIEDNLEPKIKECKDSQCPDASEKVEGFTCERKDLALLVLVSAAAVDAINPCAFAVLILLVAATLGTGDKKKGLKSGFSFISAVYVVYFLLGIGILSFLRLFTLSGVFYKTVGGLAILLGLSNIKDFIKYGGGGFLTEVPLGWRDTMKKFIARATTPIGAFLMGSLVSLILLPCTSGPYIAILSMLSKNPFDLKALSYLLLYNLIFILPMIAIVLICYRGFSYLTLETLRKKKIRLLHLIAGIILVCLGVAMIAGLI
ncbi:hypothetical protein COY23_04475 [bacterium (Candidatus Torokbacteria) CG_4_10_14_0_2_um_filter_35_8]|nr:MAG: hypothetical protein COY23_04475 [bacterium (Candidatus Torokbacteria) CG_4_10_14_0_2_um_filter_35_8]